MQKLSTLAAIPSPPYVTKAATIADPERTKLVKCPECVCYFQNPARLAAHANVWHYKSPPKSPGKPSDKQEAKKTTTAAVALPPAVLRRQSH
ncbi:hypothetical protein GGI15_001745 [Coemansia interrupta]|uniref:C2H2-type domain-containing protein n=1 Tax=Coemansia interrupta TaxID=1126814 RepID=A0A9W8LM22_9FUNG|nr:hypothetical protein GGI15_001745 [Coemansia interrupta]